MIEARKGGECALAERAELELSKSGPKGRIRLQ